ncbi:DNA (cytosine-5-)-methyltransferase [Streptococcus uberis]|nr:DNA (cytosine-5-)-methyltransferase [Streptococcus uberis]MCK1202223.1 DNA (cytosine-5-)-methyltransferase [Streptococcus uberis]
MSGNTILNIAKHSENTDEWFTSYSTVEKELIHYSTQFMNKIVFCNADDPFESSFSKYFLKNFNRLKLKKLICTSYKHSTMHELQYSEYGLSKNRGFKLEVDFLPDFNSESELFQYLIENRKISSLKGDGDFRSVECENLLSKSDIVVTNPPFSKFSQFIDLILLHNKQFLLIGNQNALLYKNIFPLIKYNRVHVGHNFGDMKFKVPKDTQPRKTRFWIDETGQKWRSLGNAMWLTNLDVDKQVNKLILNSNYSPENYPKYDNFNAIHVKKVSEIPIDFQGIMGVPLTYLKYHDENKFEIIGEANHGSDNEFDLFKPIVSGKEMYKRILIKKKNEPKKQFKILDLFCGAGGMSYGMDMNDNFQTVVASDVNYKLAVTLEKNIPEVDLIIGDITNSEIQEKIIKRAKEKNVNMVVGGPPCQGFSLKGKKLGLEDPRNFLFVEYLKIVEKIQPEVFVIENVKALLSTSNGWFKEQIIEKIQDLGYKVKVEVLNASDYGVPQNRERAIFICSKNFEIPLPVANSKTKKTVRDAISDLSYLESNEGDFEQDYITEPESQYQKFMRSESSKLYNHKASNHNEIAIRKLSLIPPEKGKEFLPKELLGNQKYKSTWGRLIWDSPSPTIDTRFDAASNGRNNHPFLNRSITPREAARLQSFKDDYIFYGNKVDIRTQIGNAVPPLMALAIANQIENTFKLYFKEK